MIHIDHVLIHKLSMPLVTPFETSSAKIDHKELIILEVRDQSGITVFSECVAKQIPNYMPETVDTAIVILTKHILPLIMHRSFDTPQTMSETIDTHVKGNYMAKASIDMAAWAIFAEQRGQSLSRTLGGVKSTIDCGISIGVCDSPQALLERVQSEAQHGYKKIKLKIKPGKDLDFVGAIRNTFPTVSLMVDANSAYSVSDQSVFNQLDGLNLLMIEQPLAWDDIIDHAHIQRRIQTPICLDESICHHRHAASAHQLQSAKIINIKPGRVGGLSESLRIHDYCASVGMPVWCGGMLETGIGRAYNVALASLSNFSLPGDISPSHRYWKTDIIEQPWQMSPDGCMTVPVDEPGIGVMVDRDALAHYTMETIK